ncbi:hypothetical protein BSL78_04792 [Apostichopus japonicus]|uniref:CxC2-like cysteine cluster KDZ transposase-associated domain-containing protein n=1 Tax=Stichopus japonicus TaxID=307972 RepID=A0A2G8LDC0_STIJA|nr:hypothetical protein BSL78_04792 [Apostichopus japonicus]
MWGLLCHQIRVSAVSLAALLKYRTSVTTTITTHTSVGHILIVQTHQRKLHVPCSYEDETLTEVFVKQEPWYPKGDHDCESVQTHNIVVVDYKGRQHDIPVAFCNCESEATQLIRMGLWPASAFKPQVAFSVDLMRWLTVMSLECHVALRNLCQALSWMVPKTLPILVKNLYSLLSKNSFAEFHFMCNQLDSVKFLENSLFHKPLKPSCLACPRTGDKRILSLDAMFGLKRWKKSGSSELPPKYVDSFFLEQNIVDDFVQSYHHQATSKQNCSTFQAGDLMQSKNKSKKIDETGVFGSVCRHEMPISFFSLRQGEQLSNAVYMVQHLLKELPNTQHYILYDIACMLEAHLKKSGQHALLSKIKLAVPAFHIYGHKPSCQITYSTRRVDGFALSDGEQVQRLWSYMRNFVTSTREMTPSHRIDALCDALIHYAHKTTRHLGEISCKVSSCNPGCEYCKGRTGRAMSSHQQGSEPITETMIRRWRVELTSTQVSPSVLTTSGADMSTNEAYAIQLSTYYDMCIHEQLLGVEVDLDGQGMEMI